MFSFSLSFSPTAHYIVRFLATNDFIIQNISFLARKESRYSDNRLQGCIFTFARASSGLPDCVGIPTMLRCAVIEYLSVVSLLFLKKKRSGKALDSCKTRSWIFQYLAWLRKIQKWERKRAETSNEICDEKKNKTRQLKKFSRVEI